MKFFGQILSHDPVQNCEIRAFREKTYIIVIVLKKHEVEK
jgi:hypothetical protein